MTYKFNPTFRYYVGLSTETKPTNVSAGDVLYEVNTIENLVKKYISYDGINWNEEDSGTKDLELLLQELDNNTDNLEDYTDQIESLITDLKNLIGEVQETPTVHTLLSRVKSLEGYVDNIETLITSTNVKIDSVYNTISSTPTVGTMFKDTNGNINSFKNVDGKPRCSSMPYLYDIAKGNVSGHFKVTKLGINTDVDNSIETLWGAGGLYVFPSSAIQMEIVSSSANDASGNTGARTVHIHYLDENYNEQLEIITMNGTTPVVTVATNMLRINSFHVNTTGTNNASVGNITLRGIGGGTTYAYILAGFNNSQQSVHTVPSGKTLYLVGWQVSSGNSLGGTFVTFRLMSNVDNNENINTGSIFHVKDIMGLEDTSQNIIFQIPFKIPEKSDVMITAVGDAGNSNAICSGRFHGWQE